MMKKPLKIGVAQGDAFFCDGVTIAHSPTKFILDFKQRTPRFDPSEEGEEVTLMVKHNVVVIDADVMKSVFESLKDNIAKYEKQYGKLKKPKTQAVKKAESAENIEPSSNYIG